MMQLDTDTSGSEASSPDHEANETQSGGQRNSSPFTDERSITFLQWATGTLNSAPWTKLGSIRHTDIIQFGSVCYISPISRMDHYPASPCPPGGPRPLLSLVMTFAQVKQVTSSWPKHCVSSQALEDGDIVSASFALQNSCNMYTWQIERVLICLLWKISPACNNPDVSLAIPPDISGHASRNTHKPNLSDFAKAVTEASQLHSPEALQLALGEVTLVLTPSHDGTELQWGPDTLQLSPQGVSEGLKLLMQRTSRSVPVISHGSPYTLRRKHNQATIHAAPKLAIRAPSWPESCPQFCLFVFGDMDNDERVLHRLLEDAIEKRNYLGPLGFQWDRNASRTLGRWRKALADAARGADEL